MAIRCTKCGTYLMEGERFCPNCGENAPQPPEGAAPSYTAQQPSYDQYGRQAGAQGAQGGYGAPVVPTPAPSYNTTYVPPVQAAAEEMSVGKWVGTIIVTTFFGLISLIFLFVWGFGSGPKSRQNFCKAMLIVKLIFLGISVLFFLILIPALVGYADAASHGYDSFYNSMTAMMNNIPF